MNLRTALKAIYHACVPIEARRWLRLTRWTANRRVRVRLWKRTDGRVAAGPFAGLRLLAATPGDCEGSVLLGSFECETHTWLEDEFLHGWSIAVNIGSNAGYYSTGLAMRVSGATVYAFEADPRWREETLRSAIANGVADRVRALGTADVGTLAALPVPTGQGALVICDCEGCERDLLDPTRVGWLAHSALCIELHDFAASGATEILHARFRATHECVIAEQRQRDPTVWAERAGIDRADAAQLCDEGRDWGEARIQGRWLLASPRGRAPAP